jgi:hypothetical protein
MIYDVQIFTSLAAFQVAAIDSIAIVKVAQPARLRFVYFARRGERHFRRS